MKLCLILLTALSSLFATLEQQILQSDFTITISSKDTQPMSYAGSFTVQGEKFLIQAFGMDAAYDGETMYIYQEETDELTLSNPTAEELHQTNPLLFAKALVASSKVTEKAAADGKTVLVTLIPQDKTTDIERMNLRIRVRDNMPIMIEIKEHNRTSTMRMGHPKCIQTAPKYQIEKEGAYVNDLR